MAEREPRHGEQLPWRLGRRRTAKGSDPARRAEEASWISLRRWLGWTQGAQLAVLRVRPGSREGAMSADVHAAPRRRPQGDSASPVQTLEGFGGRSGWAEGLGGAGLPQGACAAGPRVPAAASPAPQGWDEWPFPGPALPTLELFPPTVPSRSGASSDRAVSKSRGHRGRSPRVPARPGRGLWPITRSCLCPRAGLAPKRGTEVARTAQVTLDKEVAAWDRVQSTFVFLKIPHFTLFNLFVCSLPA